VWSDTNAVEVERSPDAETVASFSSKVADGRDGSTAASNTVELSVMWLQVVEASAGTHKTMLRSGINQEGKGR
jgi:hypothetical protein